MASPISFIMSTTHPIGFSFAPMEAGEGWNHCLAAATVVRASLLRTDLVIITEVPGLDSPRCIVEQREDNEGATRAFALTLVPRFTLPPLASQRYLFLVDRSGSMEPRIAKTRDALQVLLRSLPARGTAFNIASFGSQADALWPSGFVPYDAANVAHASRFVSKVQADYGGTEIVTALKLAFRLSRANEAEDALVEEPTAVIVLTDGEAWDVQSVARTVAQRVDASNGKLRVFVLGIGEQVSKAVSRVH
jgi:hypothetical protein